MTFWDRQAKRFDTDPPTPEDDEAMAGALRVLPPDARVLEIGCAAGAHARAMVPHVASWHGIDVSAEMVRRAQQYAGDGLTFQQATLDQVEPDGYTAVVAFNVLHFLDLPDDLERIARLLPPGGLLVAQTPCLGDMPAVVRWMVRGVASVLRVPGLRRLRFAELRDAVEGRFDVVEAEASKATETWLVAKLR